MDTKSYRRELAERIAGQPSPIGNDDLDRFIGQLLSDARTHIKRINDVYELTFHGEILDTQRTLFASGPKRKAVFRPARRPDTAGVEFMAFGHPIVDAIVTKVLGEDYEGVTGTRRIPASDDLAPCAGWLFTYQFTIPGVRSTEHLEPVFVSDDGKVDLESGHSLVRHAYQFDIDEKDIEHADIPVKVVADGPDYESLTGSIKFVDAAGTKTTLPITFSTVGLFDPGSGLQQLVFLDAATAGGGISVGISPLAVPHPAIGVAPLLVGGGVGPPLAIFGPFPGTR